MYILSPRTVHICRLYLSKYFPIIWINRNRDHVPVENVR